MPIKLYCEVCGAEIADLGKIPEKSGSFMTGHLQLAYGLWQEPQTWHYNWDLLCEKCTEAIKKAIDDKVNELKKL